MKLGHITPEEDEWLVHDGKGGIFVCDEQWQAEVISCLWRLLNESHNKRHRN